MSKLLIFLMLIIVGTPALAQGTKVNRTESFSLYVNFDSSHKDNNLVL
jgi:hypothetical protein